LILSVVQIYECSLLETCPLPPHSHTLVARINTRRGTMGVGSVAGAPPSTTGYGLGGLCMRMCDAKTEGRRAQPLHLLFSRSVVSIVPLAAPAPPPRLFPLHASPRPCPPRSCCPRRSLVRGLRAARAPEPAWTPDQAGLTAAPKPPPPPLVPWARSSQPEPRLRCPCDRRLRRRRRGAVAGAHLWRDIRLYKRARCRV